MYGGSISKETFTKNICGLFGRKKLPEAQDADLLFDDIKKSAVDRVTFGKDYYNFFLKKHIFFCIRVFGCPNVNISN